MKNQTRTLCTVLENILPRKCTIHNPEKGTDLWEKKKVELAMIQLHVKFPGV